MDQDFDKDDLLGRWLGGSLSPEEEATLRAREDFAEYERLAQETSELRLREYDSQSSLDRLKARRQQRGAAAGAGQVSQGQNTAPVRPLVRANTRWWYGIAATLLLALSAWFFWPTTPTEFSAPLATTESADLPDGSRIRLNAGSVANWATTAGTRQVTLDGEAYFDVVQDGRTFVVQTDLGEVTVLGTSFNVYARAGTFRVSCASGRVRVDFGDGTAPQMLQAGESTGRDHDGTVAPVTAAQPADLDWLAGRSVFTDRPLREVLAELARQFDLEIRTPPAL
ncbi:MAG: FecR domain-containing protein, partial [Bacteroidota bacterium]